MKTELQTRTSKKKNSFNHSIYDSTTSSIASKHHFTDMSISCHSYCKNSCVSHYQNASEVDCMARIMQALHSVLPFAVAFGGVAHQLV